MRTPLIAANWKMHKTVDEAMAFLKVFRRLTKDVTGVDIVIAPPFTALTAVVAAVQGSSIAVAGQDVFWEADGAFTGAISPKLLLQTGATRVIIGHSERRQIFGDSDEAVNRKMSSALDFGLAPILCVGETLEERDNDETLTVLTRQICRGLDGLAGRNIAPLVVAYEPVWAIGTGHHATAEQAGQAHSHIRTTLRKKFGKGAAESCRIVYGGSVKPGNVRDLVAQSEIDGALVGGASLDPESFFEIVEGGRITTV
ncbi:MAG: triose-phosphate isomerase [Vicinamibacterales bacterium]|nr:triose-phosphate isomerase [Acidobacteriota bacterium]MDP7210298.1 triose-phosphate isomerase [Vicinamibacterales bacterium]HJO16767.1 triose-phosphate isomerase [Vicinamibacterales bacterium]|tara:strand:- start:52573 stop:53340 length:768 start_codon:yes stop_codon:yes gene_type:complete